MRTGHATTMPVTPGADLQTRPGSGWPKANTMIDGLLVLGGFRDFPTIVTMSSDDRRNTLIADLSARTNQPVSHYQGMDDATLAGTGATLLLLREIQACTDDQLRTISDEDQRTLMLTALNAQTGTPVSDLRAKSNAELVGIGLTQDGSAIRGVLLLGQFRTFVELNTMSRDDRRNTLITELVNRTKQPVTHYQAMTDPDLAGAGAVLVFLRLIGARTDDVLATLSDDDQRNLLIVTVAGKTGVSLPELQALSSLELVLEATGLTQVRDRRRSMSQFETGGLLSQVIANVRLAHEHVTSITGLPPAAAPAQARIGTALATMVPAVELAASTVLRFTGVTTPLMDAATAAIAAGDGSAMKKALDAIQASMRSAAQAVDAAVSGVKTGLADVTAASQSLAAVGSDLGTQITHAVAEATAADEAAESLERNKYWWILAGPFGVIGLSVCIGMIVTQTNEVNRIRRHINDLRAQSAQWTKMQADLGLLQHAIPNLSSTMLTLRNALGFIGGDITNVVTDVEDVTTRSTVARAYLLVVQQQLDTLRADAS